MLTVGINNFELYTSIGMYPEEKLLPTKLLFNVAVRFPTAATDFFLDYTLLITIIKESCKEHVSLLETLLSQIIAKIKTIAPAGILEISIEKCNPPTGDAIQASFVMWKDEDK